MPQLKPGITALRRRSEPVFEVDETARGQTPGKLGCPVVASTGHANSPATIFIHKKSVKTPKILPRKGRKSMPQAGEKKLQVARVSLDGVENLFSTPPATSPSKKSRKTVSNTQDHLFEDLSDYQIPIVKSENISPAGRKSCESVNPLEFKELFAKRVKSEGVTGVREPMRSPSPQKTESHSEKVQEVVEVVESPAKKLVPSPKPTRGRKRAAPVEKPSAPKPSSLVILIVGLVLSQNGAQEQIGSFSDLLY